MSVGESVSEVDLEAAEGGGPVVGAPPLARGALDGEVDELGGGLFVGKVAAGLDALSDLAVEDLDAVGRVDRAAQLAGQGENETMCSQRARQEAAIIGYFWPHFSSKAARAASAASALTAR
jgi:hypothetical protein